MMLQIPVSAQVSADLVHRIDLGGQMVTMRFEWNTRAGAWFLHISDDLGNTMLGVKLVPNWPIFKHYRNAKPITGDIILLPVDDSVNWPPTYDEMGVKWFPFWIDEENANTWKQTQARAVPYIPTPQDAPIYPPLAPQVLVISPATGSVLGGTPITITGHQFLAGAAVTIGGVACTDVVLVSMDQITAVTPAGSGAGRDVIVANPNTLAGTLAGAWTYQNAGMFIAAGGNGLAHYSYNGINWNVMNSTPIIAGCDALSQGLEYGDKHCIAFASAAVGGHGGTTLEDFNPPSSSWGGPLAVSGTYDAVDSVRVAYGSGMLDTWRRNFWLRAACTRMEVSYELRMWYADAALTSNFYAQEFNFPDGSEHMDQMGIVDLQCLDGTWLMLVRSVSTGDSYLYRSTDMKTWTACDTGEWHGGTTPRISPLGGGLWLVSFGHFYSFSTDDGVSWFQSIGMDSTPWSVAVHAFGTMILGGGLGYYELHANGASFQIAETEEAITNLSYAADLGILVSVRANGSIWTSTNGTTWTHRVDFPVAAMLYAPSF